MPLSWLGWLESRPIETTSEQCGTSTLWSRSEQANLPAEQPTPGEDPWVPVADAYARRAGHSRRTSSQGPLRAGCLTGQPVLPAARRVRRPAEFTTAIAGGVRAGRRTVVVHYAQAGREPAKAGFVVSKAVGNSVVRHRVVRRLRHLAADELGQLPLGSHIVVRALPASADATSTDLGRDLASGLGSALKKWERRQPPTRYQCEEA